MDFNAYTVLFAVLGAAAYGIIFFIKAWVAMDPKPPFDPYKFGATLGVAIIIGLIAGMTGAPLTEADFLVQMGAYAGYVAILETLLKALLGSKWPAKYANS